MRKPNYMELDRAERLLDAMENYRIVEPPREDMPWFVLHEPKPWRMSLLPDDEIVERIYRFHATDRHMAQMVQLALALRELDE